MKRLSSILMAVLFCSLQGYAQFWISFGWNEPLAKTASGWNRQSA